ncbi:MAG TPA: hypothetical protein DCZ20_10750 [Lachnospiraceae bacterium]|nr:hypothetical protein [Lachnospiraceae bacterium]
MIERKCKRFGGDSVRFCNTFCNIGGWNCCGNTLVWYAERLGILFYDRKMYENFGKGEKQEWNI